MHFLCISAFMVKTTHINKTYLINLASTLASQGATALAIILLTPELSKQLGDAKFSLYGVLLNLTIVASVLDGSLNTTLVRRLILYPTRTSESINTVFNFFLVVLGLSLPVYYLVFLLNWVQVTEHKLFMAGLIALVVAQNMLAVMFESVMQSVNQWRDAKLIRVVRTLLETALLYWVLSYQRVEYLLLVTTGVNLLYLISLYAYARRHVVFRLTLGCLKWKNLLVQLKDSFWYFQNTIASVITFNFQIIMMSHLLTAAQMTIYLLVFRFFEIIRAGLTNFAMLLFPSITSRQKMGDWIGLQQYYTRAIIAVSIIVGLTMSAVLIWGDEVFVYWSKEQSSIALSLFFVYGIYVGLLVIDHVSVVFVSALKFNRNTSVMSSVQSVLLIILTYVFIRQYGVLGAAFASVTAFVTTSLWYNPFHLWRKMRGLAN